MVLYGDARRKQRSKILGFSTGGIRSQEALIQHLHAEKVNDLVTILNCY